MIKEIRGEKKLEVKEQFIAKLKLRVWARS